MKFIDNRTRVPGLIAVGGAKIAGH
jgi:hypothetical protein